MTAYGCSELQGYYFAKPMPRAALETFIKDFKPAPVTQEKQPSRMAAAE
jgi:predicted signal transduction protein with EAL and GGDEF domain